VPTVRRLYNGRELCDPETIESREIYPNCKIRRLLGQ
jgi:hypothetical protein